MNPITRYLLNTLRAQLDQAHVVVWYDPRGEYTDWLDAADRAAELGPHTTLTRYEPARGYLALRRALEPLWEDDEPPRLLLYVAESQPEIPAERALVEYEMAGVVLRPGTQPPERDTALAAVARRALAAHMPAARIENLAGQLAADPPQITLADLERLVAQGKSDGVLNTLYDEARSPADLALAFLADPGHDAELTKRQAVGQMSALLSETLGFPFGESQADELREAAARRVLLADLALGLGPDALSLPPLPDAAAARQAAVELAAAWRDREPLAAAYVARAATVETAAGLASRLPGLHFPTPADAVAALSATQTFAATEARLQTAVEEALLAAPTPELVALATARRDGFWGRHDTEIRARWSAILSAVRVLQEAARVRAGLRGKEPSAATLWAAYIDGRGAEAPWCLLDRYQRHFERDYHTVDVDERRHDAFLRLAAAARAAYADAAGALAERFARAYETARFELPARRQADVYGDVARPAVADGPTAYILVDAFRYEMAHELRERLGDERPLALSAAVATPPTITDVGMAALMPGAEKGIILSGGRGKLQVIIDGAVLDSRAARVAQFGRAAGGAAGNVPVAVAKLHELTPLGKGKLRNELRAARAILITATEEIDGHFESAPAQARKQVDAVFEELRRALGVLFRLGVRTAIITADHGYLFGEDLSSADVMDRPGGQAVVEKRRVWVGRGGEAVAGTLRAPLAAFGIAGEVGEALEIVTPYNLAAFKTPGGSLSYFHGGLSLPEVAVPVLVVRAGPGDAPAVDEKVTWRLTPGSKTISTQILTVTIDGRASGLLPPTPPRVTVEVRAGGRPVSTLISATEGYEEATRDIRLALDPDDARQIATVTAILQLPEPPAERTATIHLLDAATGEELQRVDNVAITITI